MSLNGWTICIANQKGGVGKTTTAINLATAIALYNKKTLLIDIDPQGNATSGVGQTEDGSHNIYHALVLEEDIHALVTQTFVPNLFIIKSHIDLSGAEIELVTIPEREFRLKKCLHPIKQDFDFILIDCPPSLGLLTINSLVAADSVLIPLQCEYYALEGLSKLLNTIRLIKSRLNPMLVLEGILLTMFDKRNNLSHQVVQQIMEHFPTKVFKTIIPRSVRLAECPSHGKPVYFYDKNSSGSQSYLELAQYVIHKERALP
ncbi:MAG: AAA family ATPase [Desulfobacterota bacterium]|nr:AAA family ATPase [Thermodesulfobacteriota bacterium]